MTYVRWRPIALRALLLGVVLTLRGSEPLLAFLMPAPVAVLQAGRGLDTAAWILAASLLLTIIDVACWERIVPRTRGAPAPHLLRDTLRVVIYGVAAACVAAFVFQRPPIAFWTASGASAVVLGIALRSIILGLFTGIAFSVELSFRMGDWLEVGDHQSDNVFFGKVVAMTWRTTRLLLEDHRVAVIPNSRLGELILINYSQHGGGVFRSEVHVHVSAAAPADRVMRVLHAAALALTHTGDILAEPEPRVIVGAVTAHGVEYRVRYWQNVHTLSLTTGRGLMLGSVLRHLNAAGISPATPQQDVRLVETAGRSGADDRARRRLAFLRHVDLLGEALQESELEVLAQAVVERRLSAGDILLREGEAGESLFLLAEGLLEVIKTFEGKATRVAVIEPGQVVGEMSLLTGERRSATVAAISECVVQEIRAGALHGLLQERPSIAESLSRIAASRAARAEGAQRAEDEQKHGGRAALLLQRIQRFFGLEGI